MPYRDELDDGLRGELEARLRRITATLESFLPDPLRLRIAEARAIVESNAPASFAGYVAAADEAIALVPQLATHLIALPTALPHILPVTPDRVMLDHAKKRLPAHATELSFATVDGSTVAFRCDGHPFFWRAKGDHRAGGYGVRYATMTLQTSVRPAMPTVEVVSERTTGMIEKGVIVVRGTTDLLAPALRTLAALFSFSAPSLSVHRGLATVSWEYELDNRLNNETATAVLVALRETRCEVPLLLCD